MTDTKTDSPFPLKRHYLQRIVPLLIVFLLALIGLTIYSAKQVLQSIYLEQAQVRAHLIAREVQNAAPDAWNELLSGRTVEDLQRGPGAENLKQAFAHEVKELSLSRLKVYDLTGRVLFATTAQDIGKLETGQMLRDVVANLKPGLLEKVLNNGESLYELYVPLLDDGGNLRAVFELYEPVGYLDAILFRAATPVAVVPGVLFFLLLAALGFLVGRAQKDINARAEEIGALRKRLESFVSESAVTAAREAESAEEIPSRKEICTLFYSDVRDFSGFAEQNSPERVVSYLNDLMTIQIDTIRQQGGDVDKLVGDAVLARFYGDDAPRRCIAAARQILDEVRRAALARMLGIGVYRGEVISGAIGPPDRRDFTVIGDSVNISARLCAAAAANELVADADTIEAAGADGFGVAEQIAVKGRREHLSIRRWRTKAP